MLRLDKRLQAIADFVPAGARIADIGSDHAKIPIFLVENQKITFAVAGEVVSGPFEIAQKNSANFPEIEVRLADGLSAIRDDDQIDTIIIAGMGGLLISEILSAGLSNLTIVKRLILQPNNEEAQLRSCLTQHHFKILTEKILESKGKIYEIIVAEQGQQALTAEEIKFGLYLSDQIAFQKKWQRRLTEIDKVLKILPDKEVDEWLKLTQEKSEIERRLKA